MVKDTEMIIDRYQCSTGEDWLISEPTASAFVTLILAHGAGAPMDSPFMAEMAASLSAHGVRVVRFEFAYMAARREDGRKRPPNPAPQLQQCWREAHARVRQQAAGPLAIGGKSMGGRMASLLADELAADALVCLGYPFHPAGRPEKTRTAHLESIQTPTLIVQGERDALGNRTRVEQYALSAAIEMYWMAGADHDLKPLKRTGFDHSQYIQMAAQRIAGFLRSTVMAGK